MAYTQVTPPQGNINNLPPAPYNGNHETIQGAMHLIDAMLAEVYGLLATAGIVTTNTTTNTPGSGSFTGFSPTGFNSTTGILIVNADNSGTTLNDLTPGYNGQRVRVVNGGGTGTLTLTNAYSGSTASHRFSGEGDAALPPAGGWDIMYCAGTVNRWIL